MDNIVKTIIGLILLLFGSFLFSQSHMWYLFLDNIFLIFGVAFMLIGGLILFVSRFSFDDNTTKIVINILGIIATVTAALFGAFMGSQGAYSLWIEQKNDINKNVASALFIEISTMKPYIDNHAQMYRSDLEKGIFVITESQSRYYPEKGLYFTYQKEIASFNPKLASLLFLFYHDLTLSDSDREMIIEDRPIFEKTEKLQRPFSEFNLTEFEKDPISQKYQVDDPVSKMIVYSLYNKTYTPEQNEAVIFSHIRTYEIKNNIMNASELIPPILDELQKEMK